MTPLLRYFGALSPGKTILWCYLIWYLSTVLAHFDPSPALWLSSLGISAVVGIALVLSVSGSAGGRPDPWQTFRLFLMPFCVSSFSSLIKGKGYVLVFPPEGPLLLSTLVACVLFVGAVRCLKRWQAPTPRP